jgi:hypothetical protein
VVWSFPPPPPKMLLNIPPIPIASSYLDEHSCSVCNNAFPLR